MTNQRVEGEPVAPLPVIEWEAREGMVTVYDHEGHYLGCMGTKAWDAVLQAPREAVAPLPVCAYVWESDAGYNRACGYPDEGDHESRHGHAFIAGPLRLADWIQREFDDARAQNKTVPHWLRAPGASVEVVAPLPSTSRSRLFPTEEAARAGIIAAWSLDDENEDLLAHALDVYKGYVRAAAAAEAQERIEALEEALGEAVVALEVADKRLEVTAPPVTFQYLVARLRALLAPVEEKHFACPQCSVSQCWLGDVRCPHNCEERRPG